MMQSLKIVYILCMNPVRQTQEPGSFAQSRGASAGSMG